MGDVLDDDPRRQGLVREDIAGGYLAHHAQVPKSGRIPAPRQPRSQLSVSSARPTMPRSSS